MNLFLRMSDTRQSRMMSLKQVFNHNRHITRFEKEGKRVFNSFGSVVIINSESPLITIKEGSFFIDDVQYDVVTGLAHILVDVDITDMTFDHYCAHLADLKQIKVYGLNHKVYKTPIEYVKALGGNGDKFLAQIEEGNIGYILGYLDGYYENMGRLTFGKMWKNVFSREMMQMLTVEQRIELVADFA